MTSSIRNIEVEQDTCSIRTIRVSQDTCSIRTIDLRPDTSSIYAVESAQQDTCSIYAAESTHQDNLSLREIVLNNKYGRDDRERIRAGRQVHVTDGHPLYPRYYTYEPIYPSMNTNVLGAAKFSPDNIGSQDWLTSDWHAISSRPSQEEASTGDRLYASYDEDSTEEDQLVQSMSRVSLQDRPAAMSCYSDSDDQRAYCSHPSCLDANGRPLKSFARNADVLRHMRSVHERRYIDCPRKNCVRKGDQGFTRIGHLIEHRRQFHMEDIDKKGKVRSFR